FVEAWRGFRDLRQEIRSGTIRLTGPRHLRSSFPEWLLLSALAPYRRRSGSRERRLYRTDETPGPVNIRER
ncbi:MAG: hypothetical protein MJA32_04650, partial [Proteobacteria bacterium]|nr:hypothetical protein [Pseudomonadota bacterium]